MPQATVYNPVTKVRKPVNVGDPNAFAGGFVLEGAKPAPVPSTVATPSLLKLSQGAYSGGIKTQQDVSNQIIKPGLQTIASPSHTGITQPPPITSGGVNGTVKADTPNSDPTTDQKSKIYQDTGVTDLEKSAYSLPSQSTEQLYNSKYSELGLKDLKDKISNLMTSYESKKNELNTAMGKVSENPWLDETSRLGHQKRLQELSSGDIGNLESQITNMQNLYNNGLNDLNNYITRSTTDFSNEQKTNQSKLAYLTQKAESQISDLENTNAQSIYRYLPDYLTGTQETNGGRTYAKSPKIQIIKADGQQVAVDKNTGKIIAKLGSAYNSATSKIGSKSSSKSKQTSRSTQNTGWDSAAQIIKDNPTASYEDLDLEIRKNTKLGETDIKKLLSAHKKTPTVIHKKTPTVIKVSNEDMIKANKKSGYTREEQKKAGFPDEELNKVYGEQKKWWEFWK